MITNFLIIFLIMFNSFKIKLKLFIFSIIYLIIFIKLIVDFTIKILLIEFIMAIYLINLINKYYYDC
jgi:hypothetical protein